MFFINFAMTLYKASLRISELGLDHGYNEREGNQGGRSLVYIGFRYNIQKLRKRIYLHLI